MKKWYVLSLAFCVSFSFSMEDPKQLPALSIVLQQSNYDNNPDHCKILAFLKNNETILAKFKYKLSGCNDHSLANFCYIEPHFGKFKLVCAHGTFTTNLEKIDSHSNTLQALLAFAIYDLNSRYTKQKHCIKEETEHNREHSKPHTA